MGHLIVLVLIDIVVVVAVALLVGMSAPRWRGALLNRDRFPITPFSFESPEYFRRFPLRTWARRLPELGATFGGASKNALPERTAIQIGDALIEVRRAQWVHWISVMSWLVLIPFNPWWLVALFAGILAAINAPFLLILRNNHQRLTRLLHRLNRTGDNS